MDGIDGGHKLIISIQQSFKIRAAASASRLVFVGFVCLFVFFKTSPTNRLYRGRAPRLPHMRQSWETTTSVSAGHIILTPTQPVGSGRPQRESKPIHPHQESRALPTELPRPPQHLGWENRAWRAVTLSFFLQI